MASSRKDDDRLGLGAYPRYQPILRRFARARANILGNDVFVSWIERDFLSGQIKSVYRFQELKTISWVINKSFESFFRTMTSEHLVNPRADALCAAMLCQKASILQRGGARISVSRSRHSEALPASSPCGFLEGVGTT